MTTNNYYSNLRKYHNQIKREYLNEYTRKINDSHKIKLLDMCCGCGGDLNKWISNRKIKHVVGIDISQQFISEAHQRLIDTRNTNDTIINFYVGNLGTVSVCHLIPTKFDIITCHFSMHYFFEDKNKYHFFMTNVKNSLGPGGYFICTILDMYQINIILDLAKDSSDNDNSNKYESELLYIEKHYNKNSNNSSNNNSLFGNEILFNLKNTKYFDDTGPSKEYLIDYKLLIDSLKNVYGLDLVDTILFSEIKMGSTREKMSSVETEASDLNRLMVFQKKVNVRRNYT